MNDNRSDQKAAQVSIATRDEMDLARFGKIQRFRRDFHLISIIGLSCTLMVTWEGVLALLQGMVGNGGPTGAFAGYIFVWAGVGVQTLVMAEIASIIPLSGGAYNWIAVLSPPRYSKFLSYLTGWTTVIAWQALCASVAYLNGVIVQAVVTLAYPDYTYHRWHGTLIMYAVVFVAILINTLLSRLLPGFEIAMLTVHITGFVGILVTICVLGPKSDPSTVFKDFINGGGWPTDGESFLVGAVTSMFLFTGVDAASHLAEEIGNAAIVIPRCMITSVLLNGTLGLGMLVAILFTMGNPYDLLSNTFFFPFITIFANITHSAAAAVGMSSLILVVTISGSVGIVTASSRMMWAFAREDGLPGSGILSKVDSRTGVPVWSILISALISIILGLINIGSSTAFNALTSVTVAGFYSTFLLAAGVMFYRRIATPEEIQYGPFRLGKAGIPLTIAAMAYSILGWFFTFWPPFAHVTVSNFNWSVVVYFGAIIIAIAWWFIHARKIYTGPKMEL